MEISLEKFTRMWKCAQFRSATNAQSFCIIVGLSTNKGDWKTIRAAVAEISGRRKQNFCPSDVVGVTLPGHRLRGLIRTSPVHGTLSQLTYE